MIVLINYLFTFVLIIWVFFIKKPQYSFIPLFISGLTGVPVYYFGKSSSGGIFPVDIIAVTIILRFALKYGKSWITISMQRKVFLPFLLLTLWATFSSVYAITQSDYGNEYFLFLLYGIGRWWTFAFFVLLFFGYQFDETDYLKITKKLFFAFFIFGSLLIIHQYGFFELSGIEGLGPRIVETTQNILDTYEIRSMFWGSNRACVGTICFTGFWLAILLGLFSKEHRWRRNGIILAILMTIGLIGSWSRSDFAALIISFISFVLISKKKVGLKAKKSGFAVFLIIFNIWAFFIIFDIRVESKTLERYSTLLKKEWIEEGTGKYRREMHESLINYLISDKETLIIGKGANGFRSLYGQERIWSNAAHNAFLHITTELGIIGLLLTIFWLYRIIIYRARLLGKFPEYGEIERTIFYILVCFIIGRIIAGYATDSFFAVDAMLPANIMFFGFIGLLTSKSSFISKKYGGASTWKKV